MRFRFLGLHASDVLLVSYPKSGSTWLRFLLAHALTSEEVDFDSVREIIPPVGRHRRAPSLLPTGGRVVRSHEPLWPYLGRSGQPVVSLLRDGRDVALSYLAHEQRNLRFTADVSSFLDRFVAGGIDGYGPWHDHVLSAVDFERRSETPVLRVRFEDLRAAPVQELSRTLAFLGVKDMSDEDLGRVVAANTKERMRAKEATSTFLASMETDGSPFVRPDVRPGWAELVPATARQRFESTCGEALRAAGYAAGTGHSAAR